MSPLPRWYPIPHDEPFPWLTLQNQRFWKDWCNYRSWRKLTLVPGMSQYFCCSGTSWDFFGVSRFLQNHRPRCQVSHVKWQPVTRPMPCPIICFLQSLSKSCCLVAKPPYCAMAEFRCWVYWLLMIRGTDAEELGYDKGWCITLQVWFGVCWNPTFFNRNVVRMFDGKWSNIQILAQDEICRSLTYLRRSPVFF